MPRYLTLFVCSLLFVSACQRKTARVEPERIRKPPERFVRANYPCSDSIRGVWRVYRYNQLRTGDRNPSTEQGQTMNLALTNDSIYTYQADTLLVKHYGKIERLTSAHSRPGRNRNFSYRVNTSLDDNPAFLRGYYVYFRADSAFFHGSYDDGSDFWLVRDCR